MSRPLYLGRKLTNQTHVSTTDPESTLAKKEGTSRKLKYKVHTSIDADSRVILDNKVTTGACHESTVYLSRINYIKEKYVLPIQQVIADRGYGAIDNIQSLNNKDITTFIPLFSTRSGQTDAKVAELGLYTTGNITIISVLLANTWKFIEPLTKQ